MKEDYVQMIVMGLANVIIVQESVTVQIHTMEIIASVILFPFAFLLDSKKELMNKLI